MEFIKSIIDFILHIDKHLITIVQNFGAWTYLLLFAIIFAETGLVITPFLPGDSLLFAVGALAAIGTLNIFWIFIILVAAAIIGDSVNYAIGNIFGDRLLKAHSRLFKEEYIVRTHRFFEKYGGKTIVLARFVPIVRTFAPFVAGLGNMSYRYFLMYNILGAVLWVSIFVFGGYLFGNLPVIKKNFTLVIFAIVIISILPGVIEFIKHKRRSARKVVS